MNNSARKSRIIRMFFALVIASLFGFLDQAIAESNFSIIKSFPPTPYVSLPQMTEGGGGDLYGNITTNGLPSGGYVLRPARLYSFKELCFV